MRNFTKTDLLTTAEQRGYRPEILEKVFRLMNLLSEFMSVSYLRDRLVLKGGTAINLFCINELPRLSVDLDFNYIGAVDLTTMKKERAELEKIIIDICQRNRYKLERNPGAHAGNKMIFAYESILKNKGRLEIDLNYMYRMPLWDVCWRSSSSWLSSTTIPTLDIHELAAGKLQALLGRKASRDLFDSHQLLTTWQLDNEKLRMAFTIYTAMRYESWKNISLDQVEFTVKEIRDQLLPVLRKATIPSASLKNITTWAEKLIEECKVSLGKVFPFNEHEQEFLERIQNFGEIRPELLSKDENFCQRVSQHPSLRWRLEQRKK
jgi:predicted nucleotidyltransferase component of viral defense system